VLKVQHHHLSAVSHSQEASAGKTIYTLSVYLTYLKETEQEAECRILSKPEHLKQRWASGKAQRQQPEEVLHAASLTQIVTTTAIYMP